MQMLFCPNCQKRTGFRRALGFGTFFMVLITFGLWLLVIPLYPARCMACGLQRQEAVLTNLFVWWESRTRDQKIVVAGLILASALTFILFPRGPQTQQPAPIVYGPDYDKPVSKLSSGNTLEVSTRPANPAMQAEIAPTPFEHSTDNQVRLIPNLSGDGAMEDGRVYSVAVIVATSHIPLRTQLLAQGRVARFGYANMQSRPFAVIEDEWQSGNTFILCNDG